jgi:hypothetical protein
MSGSGEAYLTVSPSSGKLKKAQQISLLVQTSDQEQTFLGTIVIGGPAGTTPITVTVDCG